LRRSHCRHPLFHAAVLLQLLLFVALASAADLWAPGRDGGVILDGNLMERLFADELHAFDLTAGGAAHRVEVTDLSTREAGVRSLRGIVGGDSEAFFLLCGAADGAATAFFRVPDGQSFRMIWQDGAYQVVDIESETFTPCAGAVEPPALLARTAAEYDGPSTMPRGDRAVADDGSRYDVLVAWTEKTRTAAGGESQMRAEIQLAVDAANLVYGNSGMASRIRLVHALETVYDENSAWQYREHLFALADPGDGVMDDLHPLRDRTGADFLVLFVESTDALGNLIGGCGIGYVMADSTMVPEFEQLAMSVVSRACASSIWTLAHELGHNRGCAHNREDATVDGAFTYAYGHRFTGDDGLDYRTVMAYDTDPPSIERIPNFSHPGILWQGQPTGVPVGDAGESHCALAQTNTDALCAGFRHEHTFVEFGWSGGSTGFIDAPFASIESGIEGSRDGGWIALRGDQPTFTGLLPGDHRVYVHDGVGSTLFGSP